MAINIKKSQFKWLVAGLALAILVICFGAGFATETLFSKKEAAKTQQEKPKNTIVESAPAASEPKLEEAPVEKKDEGPTLEQLKSEININEDFRPNLAHGDKGADVQKYIVLHDTEGSQGPEGVIDYWDSTNTYVAAHFIVGRDGHIAQCVPLDKIAHHAGFGDKGHNAQYGVEDESRDDKRGTQSIGSWAPDYGMNSYSIGIEMVHIGGAQDYPEAQLEAVDKLIQYIDLYYQASGGGGQIIDHKAWRSGNSDTSAEFAEYLKNYQTYRSHKAKN